MKEQHRENIEKRVTRLLVLLVEDNRQLAANIIEYFEGDDIECDYAERGDHGLQLAQQEQFDAIILDINLPGLDGLSICQQLRAEGDNTPILMLTARELLEHKLQGFNLGADDYLVKPFDLPELVVRRKSRGRLAVTGKAQLSIADLTLDLTLKTAVRQGKLLNLQPKGWALLVALAKASPAPLSRQVLEQVIWQDGVPDSDVLKSHIYQLRQVIDKPFNSPLLHTLKNVGLVLKQARDMDEK